MELGDAAYLADDGAPLDIGADGLCQVVRSAIRTGNGRADRIHGAEGVIPLAVWIVLLIASSIIFV